MFSASGNDENCMKNERKKNDVKDKVKNEDQLVDSECDNMQSQASIKQNSKRKEKRR